MKELNSIDFNIDIEGYSGPLELLDNLIREKKLDILNLDISTLATQYYEYIKNNINTLDIDKLSSYLVMSTYLLDLKSKKILLMTTLDEQTNQDFEYERDKLVNRIIEYRKYKEATSKLDNKFQKRNQMFAKPSTLANLMEGQEHSAIEKLPNFIDPQKLLNSLLWTYEKYHFSLFAQNKIVVQELSVDEIKQEIVTFFKKHSNKAISFSEYLVYIDPLKISEQYIVTTFLAMLELVKYHFIDLTQDENDEILIKVNDLNNASLALGKDNN